MKKINRLLLWLLVGVAALQLTGCSKKDEAAGAYVNGTLVFNEGNFLEGNGSVSFLKKGKNSAQNNVFETANNTPVGGIIQSARKYNDRIYIVTNNQNFVRVVNATTLKLELTLQEGLDNPIDVAVINGKIYVTNWGPIDKAFGSNPESFVAIYNANSGAFIKKVPLTVRPQGIWAYSKSKVFVAGAGSNIIKILNSNTDTFDGEITVENGPERFEADEQGKLWVACSSGHLVRLNPATNAVERTIAVNLSSYPVRIASNGESIFYFKGNKVYKINAANPVAPTTPFAEINEFTSFNGIGADKTTGHIYVGEAVYTRNGGVKVIDNNGQVISSFTAGIAPNTFIVQ